MQIVHPGHKRGMNIKYEIQTLLHYKEMKISGKERMIRILKYLKKGNLFFLFISSLTLSLECI